MKENPVPQLNKDDLRLNHKMKQPPYHLRSTTLKYDLCVGESCSYNTSM